MFSRTFLALVWPLALTRASPPPNTEDQTIPSPKDLLLPASTSRDSIDVTLNASNALRIQCDGEKYGFNPKVTDCQNARAYYARSSKLLTYGERHSGHDVDVFPLPFRSMGGTLLQLFTLLYWQLTVLRTVALRLKADEALCYLEPVLIDTSSTGVTSINYLSDAAYELILQCAVRESKGGIATGIGKLHASRVGPSRSSD